jgi:hypothetical protein
MFAAARFHLLALLLGVVAFFRFSPRTPSHPIASLHYFPFAVGLTPPLAYPVASFASQLAAPRDLSTQRPRLGLPVRR